MHGHPQQGRRHPPLKAVGEPPFMLAISAFLALKGAVAATGGVGAMPHLDAPATPERVLMAIEALRN